MALVFGTFFLGILGTAIHESRKEKREREERERFERMRREEERMLQAKREQQKKENEAKLKAAKEEEERRIKKAEQERIEKERIEKQRLERIRREQEEIRRRQQEEQKRIKMEREKKIREEEEKWRKEQEIKLRKLKEQEERKKEIERQQELFRKEQEKMEKERQELCKKKTLFIQQKKNIYNNYITQYNTYTNNYNNAYNNNRIELERCTNNYLYNQSYSRRIEEEHKQNLYRINTDWRLKEYNIQKKWNDVNNYYNRINEERRRKEEYKRQLKQEAISKFQAEKEFHKNNILGKININKHISLNLEYINSNLIPYIKNKIMSKIEIYNHLKNVIQNYGNELIEEKVNQKLKYFNILVIGETGKGKSTLINSMLYLNPLNGGAKEGKLESITKGEPKPYISNKIPYLRLWDTEGYTYDKFDLYTFYESISSFIQAQIRKGRPEDCIHAIWYCINGTRFEEKEKQFILEFQKAYPDNKIPIILVYTQAYRPTQVQKFKKGCEDFLIENKIDFIDVIARKYNVKEPKNLRNLFNMTMNKISSAIYSATFHLIKLLAKNEIIRIYKEIYNETLVNINKDKKNVNRNNYKKILFDNLKSVFESYQEIDNDYDTLFLNIIDKVKIFIGNDIQKNLNNISEYYSCRLYNKYISIQSDINKQYKYSLDYDAIKTPFDLKVTCKNEIMNYIKPKVFNEILMQLTFEFLISYSKMIRNLFIDSFENVYKSMSYYINQKISKEITAKTKEIYNEIIYRYN